MSHYNNICEPPHGFSPGIMCGLGLDQNNGWICFELKHSTVALVLCSVVVLVLEGRTSVTVSGLLEP